MSQEKVQEFFNKVESDSTVGEKYKELLLSCKEVSKEKVLEKVVIFAKDSGYDFTVKDLTAVAEKSNPQELSNEELDSVAGGAIRTGLFATLGSRNSLCLLAGITN